MDPDEDPTMGWGPDDPDMWLYSCDDEGLGYEGEIGPDGDDRRDWSYR